MLTPDSDSYCDVAWSGSQSTYDYQASGGIYMTLYIYGRHGCTISRRPTKTGSQYRLESK